VSEQQALGISLIVMGLLWVASHGCAVAEARGGAEKQPIWERIDQTSEVACGGCHREVYREWADSLHHGAWSNANVQSATKNFTREECRSCHSPMPVLPRGRGLDRRPEYRAFNQADGVHCLSCHGLANGVAATRSLDAPCRPRYEPRLLEARMCYPCHEPTHQAFTEYETSNAFAVGVRCVDCHMQPTKHRRGRSHGPNGGLNPDFVKRALGWRCWLAGGEVRVELRNRCGHKFPGEIPSRSFVVRVDFPGHEPAFQLLRKPHKREDREDNRLVPNEVRVLRFPLPAGVKSADVRLLFKPLPLMPEDQSFELGRWSSTR
jgi:hypothetical protein